MTVQVKDLIGEDCITLDDGQEIYARIHPELVAGRNVELDFAGVEFFASPFFNAAIGQLLRDLQPETLDKQLKLKHLSAAARTLLKQVIANAKRFYAEEDYRKLVDHVLDEIAEGR